MNSDPLLHAWPHPVVIVFQRVVCFVAAWIVLSEASAADFQSPDLPPVMEFLDGRSVNSVEDWEARRSEILDLWCATYLGHFPAKPPACLKAETVSRMVRPDGVIQRRIQLTFDTPKEVGFEIELLLPPSDRAQTQASMPLLLTQPRYYQRPWGEEAVRRGYAVCYYPGVDTHHREKDYPGYESVWQSFKEAYPKVGWSSSLAIQAWVAGRALDFLLSDRCDVPIDPEQVGIIGHSRYGKQSLYAAAFDERIKAVVARSAGSPAAAGYRFTGRDTFMETVLDAPRPWALAGLRDYFGREDRLPVESNGLIAAIAPRACLLHTAYNDGSDPTFAVERTYLSARKAYAFLGKPDHLTLQYRPGNHDPITEAHVRQNLDWFDGQFGRGELDRAVFGERLLHHFDWQAWKKRQAASALQLPDADIPLQERIKWTLGQPKEGWKPVPNEEAESSQPTSGGVSAWSRERWKPEGVVRKTFLFGDGIQGHLAFPVDHQGALPVVLWLHPFNYSHGSNEGYGVEGTTIYYRLARQGFAVLYFDQCGFGDRLLEGARFYQDHPVWSKMGRMVWDVQAALDWIHEDASALGEPWPALDRDRITLLGYSLGGMVAMHAAALDARVSSLAVFCAWTPMRTDHDRAPTGGIRRWWEWHGLIPKLGLFHENERHLPYDFDDLIASDPHRPCLIYAARGDRHADPQAVDASMRQVRSRMSALTFIHAEDVNRFQSNQHAMLLDWLRRLDPDEDPPGS